MAKRVGENAFAALIIVLTIAILLSLYLTIRHGELMTEQSEPGAGLCSFSREYDCDTVLLSPKALTFGIPNSLYALVLYSSMLFCGLFAWYLRGNLWRWYVRLGLVANLAAVAVSAYFAYVLFFTAMPSICVFCVSLQGCSVFTLITYLILLRSIQDVSPRPREWALAGMLGILCLLLAAVEFLSLEQFRVEGRLTILERRNIAILTDPLYNLSLFASVNKVDIPVDEQTPMRGDPRASHTVVLFADFQCGPCARFHRTLKEALQRYPGKVKAYFKYFPLGAACNPVVRDPSYHALSCESSYAAEAANRQGEFWEYANLLFTRQTQIRPDSFLKFAEELNLNLEQFQKDMKSEDLHKRVAEDVALGNHLRIPATPGVILDGHPLSGNRLDPMFWTLLRTLDRIPPAILTRMEAVTAQARVLSATAILSPATR